MATGILLALRLLYEENEGRLGLAQDLECSVQEVLEKVVTDYGILGKRPNFRDVGACMRQMDAHNLIARLESSYEKPTGRFAILPTILAAVPSDRVRAVAEQIRTRSGKTMHEAKDPMFDYEERQTHETRQCRPSQHS